jgi:hypothetical protein
MQTVDLDIEIYRAEFRCHHLVPTITVAAPNSNAEKIAPIVRFSRGVCVDVEEGEGAEPPAPRILGKAHDNEAGEAREVFAGHRLTGHPRFHRAQRLAEGLWRRVLTALVL